jgi:lipopolysaccharide/colanic/teichoic acid biosynthesis glycosyltransferase
MRERKGKMARAVPDLCSSSGLPEAGDGAWMRGFHGAIVDPDGFSPVVLRQLAMSRRSTGFGRIQSLVELPGGRRLAVSHDARHRSVAVAGRRLVDVAPDGSSLPAPRPAPELGDRAEAPGARPLAAAPAADRPRPEPPEDESLSAFLDRRLGEARYLLLPNRSRAYATSKRIVDLTLSVLMIVLVSPVLIALAIIIRLDSPGPAIFRQERVTLGGRIFRFYKFRTMFIDAAERYPHLYDYRLTRDEFESSYYKMADDPRNTRVGRWLRRTTLDELPNLFNVVTGDLSLVGPRPDLPAFVRLYRPEELCCLFTKAGLTGVAQVAGRSLLTVRDRLTLDMRYIAQQTLLLDLRILWRTVVVVLSGRGAF